MLGLAANVIGAGFLLMQPLIGQQSTPAAVVLWAAVCGACVLVAVAFARLAPLPQPGAGPCIVGRPALSVASPGRGRWITGLYLVGFCGGTVAFCVVAARLWWLAAGGQQTPGPASGLVLAAVTTGVAAAVAALLRRRPWRPAVLVARSLVVVLCAVVTPLLAPVLTVLAPQPPVPAAALALPAMVTVVGLEPALAGTVPAAQIRGAVAAVVLVVAAVATWYQLTPGDPNASGAPGLPPAVGRAGAAVVALLLLTFVAGNLNTLEGLGSAFAAGEDEGSGRPAPVGWWRPAVLAALNAAVAVLLVAGVSHVWPLLVPGACTTMLYLYAVVRSARGRRDARRTG